MVIIRVDSNTKIASGHVMRCIAVAQALEEAGEEVFFLTADTCSDAMLEEAGFSHKNLNSNWEDFSLEIDQVSEILKLYNMPVYLIDSYSITKEYIDSLSKYSKIVYLGSKAINSEKLSMLINYSTDIDYDFYENSFSKDTKMLLGPQYAPLRKEFQNIPQKSTEEVKRILITTGNTDKQNIVEKILLSLIDHDILEEKTIDVVIGRMFESKNFLYEKFKDIKNINLHENVTDMYSLMKTADLAISANGTTVYELAAASVPTITFAMVEEQLGSACKLSELGATLYCGESYTDLQVTVERIAEAASFMCEHKIERNNYCSRAKKIMGGNGSLIIAQELINLN